MTKPINRLSQCTPDPFDDSARTRLVRMGVLDIDDQPCHDTMPVFATIFAGLFFDDICEYHDETKDLQSIYNAFCKLYEKRDHRHMFLLLSLQYDCIGKSLPDPVWWLAGDSNAVRMFMELFMQRIEQLYNETRLIEREESE